VPRIARGSNTWELAIPESATPRALFIQIKSNATIDGVRVHGDAYYGLTLVPTTCHVAESGC
jgi:hypothetical protein